MIISMEDMEDHLNGLANALEEEMRQADAAYRTNEAIRAKCVQIGWDAFRLELRIRAGEIGNGWTHTRGMAIGRAALAQQIVAMIDGGTNA